MNKPGIYILKQVPVVGEIVPPTETEEITLCDRCGMKSHFINYKKFSYRLDYWDGEDIFEGYQVYVVSERLKQALENNKITGISFEKIVVSKGEFFEMGSQSWSAELPDFFRMIINGRATGPEIWWKRVPCNQCEKYKWDLTNAGLIALAVPFNTDPVPVRTVSFDSWKGDDIFYLEDPASPVITQRFADILKQFIGEIHLLESEWV